MAAPKGNQFWKRRSKHGKDRLFETPSLLWEAACEYFQWCDDNPLLEDKIINSSKDGIVNKDCKKVRAYTLTGLCLYLGCNTAYFRQFKASLKGKDDEKSNEYATVITHIEMIVENHQFVNAAADLLNANIISRALGLIDRSDIKSDDKPISNGANLGITLPDGTDVNEFIERIKK